MCGITGIYNLKKDRKIDKELLLKMRDEITHRGPDSSGIYIDSNIGMAFRRLSIIDLNSASDQPMFNEDHTVILTCNGEIYNYIELKEQLKKKGHVFKSNGDMETIVHAYEEWGIDCIKKLRGMFAFALWDKVREKLFLCRDRLGEKPLFYFRNGENIFFASEIKSLLLIEKYIPRLNEKAFLQYLELQSYIIEASYFRNLV